VACPDPPGQACDVALLDLDRPQSAEISLIRQGRPAGQRAARHAPRAALEAMKRRTDLRVYR
jgi:hypothetical protein